MPSVSPPSDGGYNYYQKTLTDLEDELKTEHKRSEQRMEDKTKSLEESYKRNLETRDRQLEDTVQTIKENSNQAITNDRKYAQAEVDRIKRETYDKYGRYGGQESDVVTRQMEDLRRSTEDQYRKDRRDIALTENTGQARLDEEREQHRAEMETYARNARESANDTYSRAYKGQASEYDDFKKSAEKKYEELTQSHRDEINEMNRRTGRFVADTKRDYDRKAQRFQDTNDERFDKLNAAFEARVTKATQDLNDSRTSETGLLRSQVRELLESEPRYLHEKGEGTRAAIEEYDDQWRGRERVLAEDYETQIARLKEQAKESDHYYTRLNNNNLREKDAYFTKIISQVNQDNQNDKKDIEGTFARDRKQMEMQMKRDRQKADANLESQLNDASQRRDQALEAQAKAYQDTLERQRVSDEERIKALEKDINYKATSDDTSSISPAAEAAVRKSIIGEYEKTLGAERLRNDRNTDSMQREYTRRVNDTLTEKETAETTIRRQNAVDRELERSRLMSHIEGTQAEKAESLRNKDYENSRQTENMNRAYASMLEKQRREYDEVLQAAKNEASYKLNVAHQEADFSSKLAQRTFTARQNELIRDYDKRLTDQKAEYEAVIDEIKTQSQLALREGERKNRQALDEQARTYEQRMAQSEYQYKERERYTVQNYQEQLEKAQRSNALLAKKKS